jgi:uncharacterized membrane protein YccC
MPIAVPALAQIAAVVANGASSAMKVTWPGMLRRSSGRGLADRRSVTPWFGQATAQNPGPDLTRLPLGLELRGVSLAEGIRAALACAAILVVNEWLGSYALVIAALAAQMTCFADVGGSVRRRIPWLLAFTFLGAATWAGFGLLRGLELWIILPITGVFIFSASMMRVWGLAAQTVGNVSSVVAALALDRALSVPQALTIAGAFAAGGLWAAFLTLVIWRIQPDAPARREVADTWRLLAVLVADIRDLVERQNTTSADWEGHARAHRRAMRDSIERARTIVSDMVRSRGPLSPRGAQNLLRLETADQVFGILIGMTDMLENNVEPSLRHAGGKILRLLRPVLLAVAQAILADRIERPERIERAVGFMLAAAAPVPELVRLVDALAARLRIGAVIATGDERDVFEHARAVESAVPLRERVWAPLRANLGWQSAILRHAARTAVVAVPAVAFAIIWVGPFQHWLTITAVLTMQPYFAATWQRALERIGGTALGAAIGALLAFLPQSSIMTAVLVFPLSIIGFSVRQVSYGAFIACLTPLIVVLIEVVVPGQGAWVTAGMRLLYTLVGGIVAVGCCLVLWPSWEPDRLRQELQKTLLAYADWAQLSLSAIAGGPGEGHDRARGTAGVAHNNFEAALSRALQEPNWEYEDGLEAMMVADAALRRFGATLMALHYDDTPPSPACAGQWREWLALTLRDLGAKREPTAPPGDGGSETLARLGRQILLLGGALARAW